MNRSSWITAVATALLLALAAGPAWADHHEGAPGACEEVCDEGFNTCSEKCVDRGDMRMCPQECQDKLEHCKKKCE